MRIFNIIITTQKKQDDFIITCMQRLEKVDRMSNSAEKRCRMEQEIGGEPLEEVPF